MSEKMTNIEKLEKTIKTDKRKGNIYMLAVMALLTTCFVGSTMARYAISDAASDDARVAKWGVEIQVQGDLFDKEYNSSTVKSVDKVVAPGTSKQMVDIVVTGKPEVDVQIDYTADVTLTGWKIEGEYNKVSADPIVYVPIIFTVEGHEYKLETDDPADLEAAVEAAIEACSKRYLADQEIDIATDAPTVSWKWDLGDSTDAADETNMLDTAYGDMAADGLAPTVEVAITTDVYQVAN